MDYESRQSFSRTTPEAMAATIARTQIPIASASGGRRGDTPGYNFQLVFHVGTAQYVVLSDGIEVDVFDEDDAARALAAFLAL